MNLWLRLITQLIVSAFAPALPIPDGVSVRRSRVWPSDLDLSLHMNNGRYLTLMDLGRIDLLVRSGLLNIVRRDKLTPMVSAAMIRFRRELGAMQRFDIETRIVGWLDTTAVIQQVFRIRSGPRSGEIAATALVRAGLYDRSARAFVPIERLIEAVRSGRAGASVATGGDRALENDAGSIEPPPMTADVQAFLAAEAALRRPDRTIANDRSVA